MTTTLANKVLDYLSGPPLVTNNRRKDGTYFTSPRCLDAVNVNFLFHVPVTAGARVLASLEKQGRIERYGCTLMFNPAVCKELRKAGLPANADTIPTYIIAKDNQ